MNVSSIKSHLLAALVLASIYGIPSATADEGGRHLSVEQAPVAAVAVPQSDLRVEAWLDHEDGAYAPGESAVIEVRTNADAYITVLNVDADGVVTMLYPNTRATNNFVRGGAVTTIPGDGSYRIAVSEPYGVNLLKVIASSKNVPIVPNKQARSGGEVFRTLDDSGSAYARHLSAVVNQAPAIRWAQAVGQFNVVPGAVAPVVQASVSPGTVTTTTTTTVTTAAPVAAAPSAAAVSPVEQGAPVRPVPAPPQIEPGDFGLAIAAGAGTYAAGERIEVRATAEKNCSLVLLDVLADGSYSVLLPNQAQPEVWLSGGKTAFLASADSDFEIRASGAGPHLLVGLCSAKRSFYHTLFGGDARTTVTAKPLNLKEVMSRQPKGGLGRHSVIYTVVP